MKGKLPQHFWSHSLGLLYRYLQFYSHLCHHTEHFPTAASPSEFFSLECLGEEVPADGEQERAVTHMVNTYQKASKCRHIETYRKLLRGVYCKPQGVFSCGPSRLAGPINEILDHSCYFVLLKLEDISKQNQYLYYRYIILLISALVCSHTKFNMWFQEHLQGGHCVPCKLFPLIFQPHQCSWRSTPWSSPAPHH